MTSKFLERYFFWLKPMRSVCIQYYDSQVAIDTTRIIIYNEKSCRIDIILWDNYSIVVFITIDYVKFRDDMLNQLTKVLARESIEWYSKGLKLRLKTSHHDSEDSKSQFKEIK